MTKKELYWISANEDKVSYRSVNGEMLSAKTNKRKIPHRTAPAPTNKAKKRKITPAAPAPTNKAKKRKITPAPANKTNNDNKTSNDNKTNNDNTVLLGPRPAKLEGIKKRKQAEEKEAALCGIPEPLPENAVCVAVAEGKGEGLYAKEFIEAEQFIDPYTGTMTRTMPKKHSDYIAVYVEGVDIWYVNGEGKGRHSKLNHSCEPNCRLEKFVPKNGKAHKRGEICLGIFAIRDIKKGEELTFHYGNEFKKFFPNQICLCGAKKCVSKKNTKKN